MFRDPWTNTQLRAYRQTDRFAQLYLDTTPDWTLWDTAALAIVLGAFITFLFWAVI